ncbi:MAG: hypothetical protein PUP91_10895 [Rhizonema sp. PD37]|nr:hypothetical protein [Rhizonema sp. PD37]
MSLIEMNVTGRPIICGSIYAYCYFKVLAKRECWVNLPPTFTYLRE